MGLPVRVTNVQKVVVLGKISWGSCLGGSCPGGIIQGQLS